MKTVLSLILAFNLLFPQTNYNKKSIDELFINWNKSTVASLKSLKENEYAKNRLESRLAYWKIHDENQLNSNSIRYSFLKILGKKINHKNCIIIEADNSGEYYLIQNFVVYEKSNDKIDIEIYRYDRSKGWILEKTVANFEENFNAIFENKGTSFINRDDIIISHFQHGEIISSEYFLFGTLKNDEVKKIISIEYN